MSLLNPELINNLLLLLTNTTILAFGLFISLTYYHDFSKKGFGCNHIFFLQGLSTINSLIVIISLKRIYFLYMISLIFSIGIMGYNIYNVFSMSNKCEKFYQDNYNILWIFYNLCIISQIMNMFFYYTDIMMNTLVKRHNESKIYPIRHIYENDEDI